jgi:hypothetical protein
MSRGSPSDGKQLAAVLRIRTLWCLHCCPVALLLSGSKNPAQNVASGPAVSYYLLGTRGRRTVYSDSRHFAPR